MKQADMPSGLGGEELGTKLAGKMRSNHLMKVRTLPQQRFKKLVDCEGSPKIVKTMRGFRI
jgi:hypothetical protein